MDGGLVSIMQLTSLPIIIGAAIFLTWVAKRALASVPMASQVPVWIYTALIAAALTYIANRVTGTLPGNTGTLIVDAIINGALASGLREWWTTGSRPLADSGTAVKAREGTGDGFVRPKGNMDSWVLPLLVAGSLIAGCATMSPRAQLVTTHQGIQTLLASADDAERILCFGQLALPATPTECSTPAAAQVGLTDARHRAIRRAFVKAYNAQIALGAVIATWAPGTPVDLSVLLEAAAEIDTQLAQMDIKAPNISNLIQDVLRWKAEIERLRKALGGGL